ncbi:uncharacterized protein IL334_002904 [Kwoniella shivajii]|uniref:Zn(2)-C6 fungal-type domain-containing protein n=1 Tax=Kwoniella shivajii TaxID=564305 RepID=A0ABZ1CWM5_9TREE|nr:hypothetical protein IL334_002904 [Kwoniella shivajii]
MVYTTACERCRKIRMKCERPSRGQDMRETCQRCSMDGAECITKKRRVGRQPGVKNRKTREIKTREYEPSYYIPFGMDQEPNTHRSRDEIDHLPNPLQVLASEALRRQDTPESDVSLTPINQLMSTRDSSSILDQFSDWTEKVHPMTGRQVLSQRLNQLLSPENKDDTFSVEEPSVFCGRPDMARPDVAPEHDVISLQMVSLPEAQHLFDSFMNYLTNGSMYFDPKLHTLSYVRSKSSFLLGVILAMASAHINVCQSVLLHSQLLNHVNRLETHVRNKNFKSIEIVQGLLLLASWAEIPHSLSRDKTWLYVSHATALAVELRLDLPLPFCVQMDPTYTPANHDILVRNAHRVCLLLYIHDRNMAMVAGRYPIFPESTVSSQANLDRWGKHERAHRYDAPICASVSLRKIITEVHHKLATQRACDFKTNINLINNSLIEWRNKWAVEITSTLEYDIIARFSTFVLALTLLKKNPQKDDSDTEARKACETLAFEVCCASTNNYKSWNGVLNSATFDTSMVAFCAIYTLQSINRSDPVILSDWSLFRLATLQELVSELEKQAAVRHHIDSANSTSVVDAMARQLSRGIRMVMSRKQLLKTQTQFEDDIASSSPSSPSSNNEAILLQHQPNCHPQHIDITEQGQGQGQQDNFVQTQFDQPQQPRFDDLDQLLSINNAIPFIPDWNLGSLLPDATFNWDDTSQDLSNIPFFDFTQ